MYHAKSYSSHVTLLYQRPSEVRQKDLPWTRLTSFDFLDPFLQLLVRLDQGSRGTRSQLAVVHERCKIHLLSFTMLFARGFRADAHDLGTIFPRNYRPNNVSL